jgi:penicillin amidase
MLNAVGLMVAGVPAFAVGRTPHIAWGGTNLHAASSELFDVSEVNDKEIMRRTETIRVRGGRAREVGIRETSCGAVISDLPLLRSRRTIAMRWMGHRPSDEITALLNVARARNWEDFRAALDGFAAPGQNMVYADTAGHIGKTMAVHLPARPHGMPEGLVQPITASSAWDRTVRGGELPAVSDPPEECIASANEKPGPTPVPVGWFFSSGRRAVRLKALLQAMWEAEFADIAAIQQDTLMPAAGPIRDRIVALLAGPNPVRDALAHWDLRYGSGSSGALVFEQLLYRIAVALHGRKLVKMFSGTWDTRGLVFTTIVQTPDDALRAVLDEVLPGTARALRRFQRWGGMHRLELTHFLSAVPVFGKRYSFKLGAAEGGSDTLLKSGNPLTRRRHRAPLVTTARHAHELGDPDANWFVLLGGQDGWIGSTTMLDQAALFLKGEYIQVPLREESVESAFPFTSELTQG